MANVSTIRTEDDYEAALARIADILHAEIGTPEGDELDVLVDLVELYEDKHHAIGFPSAIQVADGLDRNPIRTRQ